MILPVDITNVFVAVLRRRHQEHLAALERERGLKVGTFKRPTFEVMARPGGRTRDQKGPIVLVGVIVPLNQQTEADGSVTVTWQVLIEVHAEGRARDRADLVLRRDAIAWTVAECVLQRIPRSGQPIDAIDFVDAAHGDAPSDVAGEVTASAVLDFDVTIRDAFSVNGLPVDDTPLPPGSPGGPPATPDSPAVPWPQIGSISDEIIKDGPDGD